MQKRELFFSCTDVQVTYKFESVNVKVAQLRGCHIKRDILYHQGYWIKRKIGGTKSVSDSDRSDDEDDDAQEEDRVLNELMRKVADHETSPHINSVPSFDASREIIVNRNPNQHHQFRRQSSSASLSKPISFDTNFKIRRYLHLPPGPLEFAVREEANTVRTKLPNRAVSGPDSGLANFYKRSQILADLARKNNRVESARKRRRKYSVTIAKDLATVPYVPQLRAATMLLIEAMEPDEQLVAKTASVFTLPFCFYEIAAVYPRTMPLQR